MITSHEMTEIDNLLRQSQNTKAWYQSDDCAQKVTRAMYISGRKHLKVQTEQSADGTERHKATFLRWGMGWEQGRTRNEAIARAAAHAQRCGCK